MLDYRLKIGIIPGRRDIADAATRKGIFEPAAAVANKETAVPYIKEHFSDEMTEFVDIEWLNGEGLLYKTSDAAVVAKRFKEEGVNAVILVNCNFGNEEAMGQVAKMLSLPTLLWGPQDMRFDADGMRYTDSQCGLFAISKQLRRLHVPFTYVENCPVESEVFAEGLEKFLSVACMVNNFKKLNVVQVGTRLNPFKSVMANELEVTEKFGINMNTVNMAVFAQKMNRIYEQEGEALQKEVDKLREMYDTEGITDEHFKRIMTIAYAYKEVFDETGCDVISSECWTAMPQSIGVAPCLAMSVLADRGYLVTCESDVCGAITQALLKCATRGKGAPLFGEFTVRNPENKNSELLWHCGPFPYSMKKEGTVGSLRNAGKPAFRVKDGEYTIARFQGDAGKYTLLGGEFKTTEGPHTFGTYMWAEFDDLSRIEKKLIEGPYIHHMSEVYGNYGEVLKEFCKYIPELEFDDINN